MKKVRLLIPVCILLVSISTSCRYDNHLISSQINSYESELTVTPTEEISDLSPQLKTGDRVCFGTYEQDGDLAGNDEPIIWKVLEIRNSKALFISEFCLENLPYHLENIPEITWENCTLRKWLNNDFYETAFSSDEKLKISEETIINGANTEFKISGGRNTQDKVFLLSVDEVNEYFKDDNARRANATEFIISKDVLIAKNKLCDWWLRSIGGFTFTAATVVANGTVFTMGSPVYSVEYGVRPVI